MAHRTKPIACAALCALCLSPRISAHGGLPRAFEIVVEPGNPDDVLLRSDSWGFFRTRDGGRTWSWTCAEAYGGSSLTPNHVGVSLVAGGRAIVANSFEGVRYTDDGCVWQTAHELDGMLAVGVQASPGGVFVLTSTNTGTDAGVSGVLWRSANGGDHYSPVGSPLPGDLAASGFGLAPSDERRVYVLGRPLLAEGATLERSDDGGSSWHTLPVPVSDAFPALRVAGIHPTRPDVLVAWIDAPEGFQENAPDSLLGTSDGGQTWTTLYEGSGDLPGFAFSPDGTEVAIGGPLEGVRVATLEDALVSGSSAFSPLASGREPVWGLHWDARGIAAGTDNFAAKGVAAFTYAPRRTL